METVYQIMKYEYDGCGQSWDEPATVPLRRTLEGAEKEIKSYASEDYEVGVSEYYGLVAIKRFGQYAYVRYYIEPMELDD